LCESLTTSWEIYVSHGHYKAIHFVSVHESSIHLEKPVEGAIHVTQCQHSSFVITWSQQLRLHESHHVECHIQVTAGTILEDCHHVTFYTDEGSNAADIKDFNWLRADIPSPNFAIQRGRCETAVPTARHQNLMLSTPAVTFGLAAQGPASQADVELSEQNEVEASIEDNDDEL
jgi:Tubulin binding cofactor C